MPRIATLTLDQVNRRFDDLDILRSQVSDLQKQATFAANQATIADPVHAPETTNNLNFTWTGATGVLSWPQGFIKDKNWSAQTTATRAPISSAPGSSHLHPVVAGTLTLLPSTYYWLGWSVSQQTMVATPDVSSIHNNSNVHVICQVFTGTAGQSGTAGGGGSTGGVDFSKTRYKNF